MIFKKKHLIEIENAHGLVPYLYDYENNALFTRIRT